MRGNGPRGRGRGRGGSSIGGASTGYPLTPIETFAYNPNCEIIPELSEKEKMWIVLRRILNKYIIESESFICSSQRKRLIESYHDRFNLDLTDPEVQKKIISGSIGTEYFPSELLSTNFRPGQVRHQVLGGSKKPIGWDRLVMMDHQDQPGGSQEVGEDNEAPIEEEEAFGDEDYAKDHYMDEDAGDDFCDDGDKGGDDY